MNSVEPISVESRLHSPAVPDTARRTDLAPLHPVMRDAVSMLVRTIESENLPFRVFETLRSPLRQDWLYQQGRSRSGSIVTYAQAWNSYHQYGLAVDFVLWINETWTWNTLGINAARWERLHALGKTVGLEQLKFETPHLQVAGLRIGNSGQENFRAVAMIPGTTRSRAPSFPGAENRRPRPSKAFAQP